jgi:hypothetical protein
MIATASADDYFRTMTRVTESGEFDALLTIFVAPLVTDAADVTQAIHRAAAAAQVLIAARFLESGFERLVAIVRRASERSTCCDRISVAGKGNDVTTEDTEDTEEIRW